jgi:SET and MYND domain-containing protein
MLGTSLDIAASLMNHSCDPNAFVVFEGNVLCVRSMRKLAAGEEITQCYTDVDMDVLLRRQALKSEYFFDCCCECIAPIPRYRY